MKRYLVLLLFLAPVVATAADERTTVRFEVLLRPAPIHAPGEAGQLLDAVFECETVAQYHPCAWIYKAADEDVLLIDVCTAPIGYETGLYQVLTTTGAMQHHPWFDEGFMGWVCESRSGRDLAYMGMRNGVHGFFSAMFVDYRINLEVGYYLLLLQPNLATEVDHRETDTT
jgi:hypothetical protein